MQDKKCGKSQTIHATLDYGFYPGNVSTYFRYLNPHPFDPEDWNIMLSNGISLQHISKAHDIKIIPLNTQSMKEELGFIRDCFTKKHSTKCHQYRWLVDIMPSIKQPKVTMY